MATWEIKLNIVPRPPVESVTITLPVADAAKLANILGDDGLPNALRDLGFIRSHQEFVVPFGRRLRHVLDDAGVDRDAP